MPSASVRALAPPEPNASVACTIAHFCSLRVLSPKSEITREEYWEHLLAHDDAGSIRRAFERRGEPSAPERVERPGYPQEGRTGRATPVRVGTGPTVRGSSPGKRSISDAKMKIEKDLATQSQMRHVKPTRQESVTALLGKVASRPQPRSGFSKVEKSRVEL